MKIENLKIVGRNVTYNYEGLTYTMEVTNNMMKAANDDYFAMNIGKARIGQVKSTIVMFHRIQSELVPTDAERRMQAELKRQATLKKKRKNGFSVCMTFFSKTATYLSKTFKYIFGYGN